MNHEHPPKHATSQSARHKAPSHPHDGASDGRKPIRAAKAGLRRPWLLYGVAAALVAVGLFFLLHSPSGSEKKAAAAREAQRNAALPVEVTAARQGGIGIWLDAIGTVTPLNTVNIVSRVQGQITAVHFKEGQLVKKGDPLIDIDPRPYLAALLQAEGQLERDRAAVKEDLINLRRYRSAYASRAVSKQQLDDQTQLVAQNKGAAHSDEGAVANAHVNLEYCHITAPIEGRVGLRLLDEGNIVPTNGTAPLVVITQLQPIAVVFSVPEDALPEVQTEVRAGHAMRVDALDRAKEKTLASGEFLTLDNQVDPATGTVKVKALFDNEQELLFPNQFVNARMLISTEKAQTLLATAAIQKGTKGDFVYVVKNDHTVEVRPVKTSANENGVTAVQGVKPGERIANSGFDKLQPGTKVMIVPTKAVANISETGLGEGP